MEVSISSARAEKANLQTVRERRLNICSRSEVVPPRVEEVGGPRVWFYRARATKFLGQFLRMNRTRVRECR